LRELAASLATTGSLSASDAEALTNTDAYDTTTEFLEEDAAFFKSMGVTKDIFSEPLN
jgi:uncharacterized protein YozE (UPF0346 family)